MPIVSQFLCPSAFVAINTCLLLNYARAVKDSRDPRTVRRPRGLQFPLADNKERTLSAMAVRCIVRDYSGPGRREGRRGLAIHPRRDRRCRRRRGKKKDRRHGALPTSKRAESVLLAWPLREGDKEREREREEGRGRRRGRERKERETTRHRRTSRSLTISFSRAGRGGRRQVRLRRTSFRKYNGSLQGFATSAFPRSSNCNGQIRGPPLPPHRPPFSFVVIVSLLLSLLCRLRAVFFFLMPNVRSPRSRPG